MLLPYTGAPGHVRNLTTAAANSLSAAGCRGSAGDRCGRAALCPHGSTMPVTRVSPAADAPSRAERVRGDLPDHGKLWDPGVSARGIYLVTRLPLRNTFSAGGR